MSVFAYGAQKVLVIRCNPEADERQVVGRHILQASGNQKLNVLSFVSELFPRDDNAQQFYDSSLQGCMR